MGLPFVLYAAAAVTSVLSQNAADDAQASAEKRNAQYYRAQEKMAIEEMLFDLELFDAKTAQVKGAQLSSAGSSGFAVTAFTLDALTNESAKMAKERGLMKRQGEFKASMFALRARGANAAADSLTDSNTRNMRAVGGLLSLGSKVDFSSNMGSLEEPSATNSVMVAGGRRGQYPTDGQL